METVSFFSSELQSILLHKTANFIGRDFIFTAIDHFLHRYQKGYLTIVGVPGSGKSAILAQFIQQNPENIIYYNTQIAGKNRVEEFLKTVCTQLILWLENFSTTPLQTSPQGRSEKVFVNANEGSWLFSNLLQQVSDKLAPEEKIIIVIDGLDAIDINSQAVATNLFYLPRYLPNQIYFLFTRRPYKKSNSGLLIEAPSQILDLSDYPQENREDIKKYIVRQQNSELTISKQKELISHLLISHLIGENEDNFMYVQQTLKAIGDGFYSQLENLTQIPPDLETYYQQHWQKIQTDGLSDISVDVLRILTLEQTQPMTALEISQQINPNLNAEIYDVVELIENWLEFLQVTQIGKQTKYEFYHHHFRLWLRNKIRLITGV